MVPEQKRLNSLQLMRLIAALLVLCVHATFFTAERLNHGAYIWREGTAGVDIFFVLSGFVMVYSSTRLLTQAQGWKQFVRRRVIRIVPMYWLATSIKVIAMFLTTGLVLHARLGWREILSSYLFLPFRNSQQKLVPLLNVGWTLNFEMFFYALFALGLFLRVNLYRFIGSILTILAILAWFNQPQWPAVALYVNTIVLEFFLGMLVARRCLAGGYLRRPAALALLSIGFVLLLLPWPETGLPKVLTGGIPAALILWSAASLETFLASVPRFLLFFADASYVLYLFHPMIAPGVPALMRKLGLHSTRLSIVGCIAVSLCAAAAIHQYVEVPVTRFAQQLTRRRLSPAAKFA